jgi:hypothetical protein
MPQGARDVKRRVDMAPYPARDGVRDMADPNKGKNTKPAKNLPAMSFSWRVRFSPQVIVLLLMLFAAIPPLKGAIVSGVFWWWDKTYIKAEYVMDEAQPNDGSPYIAGHLDGSTERHNLVGLIRGTTIVVKALPQEAFAPGKRIPIWTSADAPNFVVFGDEVNDVPVAAFPQRPGLLSLLGYLAWLIATLVVGFGLMGWVARRWSRTYDNASMRG